MTLKYLELGAGIGLFSVAVIEIVETLGEDGLGLHHGVAVFALAQIIKAVIEIYDSLKTVNRAVKHG